MLNVCKRFEFTQENRKINYRVNEMSDDERR